MVSRDILRDSGNGEGPTKGVQASVLLDLHLQGIHLLRPTTIADACDVET